MNNGILLLFPLLLGILVMTAAAQSYDNVVINEVDINPPGDDSKNISEWVEIYNPTDSKIDLSGWEIASTTVLKKTFTIPSGAIIEPDKFLKYSYQTLWFTDSNDQVELRDNNGIVIDKTPFLSDLKNDFSSWQRIYDGYDHDSINDWKFTTSNAGSTNGKQQFPAQDIDGVSITLSSDKSSYLFDQTALISGSVSKEVVITQPYFQPEKIIIMISGPNYQKTIELFPDRDLNFSTSLSLQRVLGINQGQYNLEARYSNANAETSFTVGKETIIEDVAEVGTLSLTTDKSQYIPGQTITLTGTATDIIPYEGLDFSIVGPEGNVISTGDLFPTNGKFFTTVFLTTVNPVYGLYEITGEYSDKTTKTTFEVVEDFKENAPISLWTDRIAYEPGDTVEISGRLNNVWISSLDLEIIQTKNIALSFISDSGFKILDVARIQGDGTFSYSFEIPDNTKRLGDYRITVSKEIGSASITIHAVENSSEFALSQEPLSLSTPKHIYELGELLTITGFIENPSSRSSFETDVVRISISNEDVTPLQIIGLPSGAQTRQNNGVVVAYEFTAVPTQSGHFSIETDIAKNVFQEGTYLIKAEYLGLTKNIFVEIIDPLKLTDGASLVLNKEVFGLGEKLTLNGLIPPRGDAAVAITLTKPDGTKIDSGASVDNQKFSWTWITPITEKPSTIKSIDDRSVSKTNFGVYKIRISTDTYGKDIFFKVSPDPQNDSLSLTPLYVSTEKSLYKAGEKLKVVGNVITREQGNEGLVVPDRVTLRILDGTFPFEQIHEAFVFPNQGGQFQSLFELPPTVFSEGPYKVKALYKNKNVESTFSVTNDFLYGSDEPVSLLLSTDKTQYHPGDEVILSGKPNKLIYLEKFDVSVIQKSENEITCGSFFCGKHIGKITTIRPDPAGSFTYLFKIPDSPNSVGTYEMTVDADFETKSIQFDVIEKPPEIKTSSTVIEKHNRISESKISIITEQKTVDEDSIAPRVITGSLLTSRADQSDVNLRITSESGICIIGPELDCLVNDSTRKPGQIYDLVDVDGMVLKVRYSGPDVRLEKFDILPESSNVFLSDSTWNVDILKEDQVSRFYYKINYKTLE